jgi:hypothetical protein
VRDLELSHGADPIAELLAELDETEAEWSHGASLYGPGGLFEAQRKKTLAVIAMEIRESYEIKKQRSTNQLVDDMAHANKEYGTWLDRHEIERAKWLALDAHRDGIIMRINRGQAMLRVASRIL